MHGCIHTGGPRLVFPDGGHFINKFYAAEIADAALDFMSLESMKNDVKSS
jgi:hypothetical protein